MGAITIHWYGVCIVLGFLLGLWISLRLADRYELPRKVIYDMCFYGLIFGLIGDRLYYVIYAWEFYRNDLLSIVKIWEGGLAIHGGIIGGAVTLLVITKYSPSRTDWNAWMHKTFKVKNVPWILYFWFLTDLAVVILISGLAIGRYGNYFNQELFGTPTDLPWGIPIEQEFVPQIYETATYFHPTFLYESIGDILILGALVMLHRKRLKSLRDMGNTKTRSLSEPYLLPFGTITMVGLSLYSILRFFNEFLRIDYSPVVFGIRWAQIASIVLLVAVLLVYRFHVFPLQKKLETRV